MKYLRQATLERKEVAGFWWLTPIILATGEAKIRSITT
jgi:hypothetical protein